MKGKVIEVRKVTDKFTELTIEEYDSKEILRMTVSDDKDRDYLDKMVVAMSAVIPIANSNMDFEYPEGTIGN